MALVVAVRFSRSLEVDTLCGFTCTLLGVQTVLLRNNGTVGRRLKVVDVARGGTEDWPGVVSLLRGRSGLEIAGILLKCFFGVFTLDGVRFFCNSN